MQSYDEFPPFPYFINVLKQCPRAAWIYAKLWASKDCECKINCTRDDIRYNFFMSPTLFRNALIYLVDLGLASIKERPEADFEIELVDFDQEDFDAIDAS